LNKLEPIDPTPKDWEAIIARSRRHQAGAAAGRPKKLQSVMAQLMVKRGYGRQQTSAALADHWREVAGEFVAEHTRIGELRRGVLNVTVANSMLMQELSFEKQSLLEKLSARLPDQKLRDFRFRVAPV
jgi:predicted nucleic acid-binding Zn ribbon protein